MIDLTFQIQFPWFLCWIISISYTPNACLIMSLTLKVTVWTFLFWMDSSLISYKKLTSPHSLCYTMTDQRIYLITSNQFLHFFRQTSTILKCWKLTLQNIEIHFKKIRYFFHSLHMAFINMYCSYFDVCMSFILC